MKRTHIAAFAFALIAASSADAQTPAQIFETQLSATTLDAATLAQVAPFVPPGSFGIDPNVDMLAVLANLQNRELALDQPYLDIDLMHPIRDDLESRFIALMGVEDHALYEPTAMAILVVTVALDRSLETADSASENLASARGWWNLAANCFQGSATPLIPPNPQLGYECLNNSILSLIDAANDQILLAKMLKIADDTIGTASADLETLEPLSENEI